MPIVTPPGLPITIPQEELEALCSRWEIQELALFGSVLRSDFGPDSDIDVLVTFAPKAHWSLFDLVGLQDELEHLVGRPVDVVEKAALRNPFRRREILRTHRILYAA